MKAKSSFITLFINFVLETITGRVIVSILFDVIPALISYKNEVKESMGNGKTLNIIEFYQNNLTLLIEMLVIGLVLGLLFWLYTEQRIRNKRISEELKIIKVEFSKAILDHSIRLRFYKGLFHRLFVTTGAQIRFSDVNTITKEEAIFIGLKIENDKQDNHIEIVYINKPLVINENETWKSLKDDFNAVNKQIQ
jgi:hypothetical protein